jgi:hypothetical protein
MKLPTGVSLFLLTLSPSSWAFPTPLATPPVRLGATSLYAIQPLQSFKYFLIGKTTSYDGKIENEAPVVEQQSEAISAVDSATQVVPSVDSGEISTTATPNIDFKMPNIAMPELNMPAMPEFKAPDLSNTKFPDIPKINIAFPDYVTDMKNAKLPNFSEMGFEFRPPPNLWELGEVRCFKSWERIFVALFLLLTISAYVCFVLPVAKCWSGCSCHAYFPYRKIPCERGPD